MNETNKHNIVANWGLPLAAIADMKRSPEYISGKMTTGEVLISHFISTIIIIFFFPGFGKEEISFPFVLLRIHFIDPFIYLS